MSVASAQTFPPGGTRPALTSLQASPSLNDSKTPPATPADSRSYGPTVSALTSCWSSPAGVQTSPLSVDRKTPPPTPNWETVPAKTWPLGATASAATSVEVSPALTSSQWSPSSVERKTPAPQPVVPAKTSPSALTASETTFPHVRPMLTASQWSPLSIERKTPPFWYVPAKRWPFAAIASERPAVTIGPVTSCQVSPWSAER